MIAGSSKGGNTPNVATSAKQNTRHGNKQSSSRWDLVGNPRNNSRRVKLQGAGSLHPHHRLSLGWGSRAWVYPRQSTFKGYRDNRVYPDHQVLEDLPRPRRHLKLTQREFIKEEPKLEGNHQVGRVALGQVQLKPLSGGQATYQTPKTTLGSLQPSDGCPKS